MKKSLLFVLMFGGSSVAFACGSFDECMDKISDSRGNIPYSAVEAYSAKAQAYAIKELVDYVTKKDKQMCIEVDTKYDKYNELEC